MTVSTIILQNNLTAIGGSEILTRVDATAAPASVTVGGSGITLEKGKPFSYMKTDVSANAVTLTPNDLAKTLAGSTTYVLSAQGDGVTFAYDGVSDFALIDSWSALTSTAGIAAAIATEVTARNSAIANASPLATQVALCSPFLGRTSLPLSAALTANKAYWLYMGCMPKAGTVEAVQFAACVAGIGAQVAEVALATSSAPPSASGNADLTVASDGFQALAADVTVAAVRSETVAFGFSAGAHVWLGIRFNMAATQPILSGVAGDFGRGYIQTTAAAGVLGEGVYAGAVPSPTIGGGALVLSGPDLTCKVRFT